MQKQILGAWLKETLYCPSLYILQGSCMWHAEGEHLEAAIGPFKCLFLKKENAIIKNSEIKDL